MAQAIEQSPDSPELRRRREASDAVKRFGEVLSRMGKGLPSDGDRTSAFNTEWRELESIRMELEEIVNRL